MIVMLIVCFLMPLRHLIVHYIKLFKLLIERGICPVIARFLLNLYTNQKLCIKLGAIVSPTFSVSNGVKQGGVLSPILLCVYMDELLYRFRLSGFGSHVGNIYIPAIGYTDDVALLAPTISSLKLLLNVVNSFGNEYCVRINPDKSKLLVFGKSYNSDINNVSNNSVIPSSLQTDHLGHVVPVIGHEDINSLCNFMLRMNFLLSNFKHCSHNVKYRLVKSYCMAFYGYVLLDLSSKNINKLYVTWRKCIRKFLDIPYQTHSRYISFIFDDVPIKAQLHKRSVKFLSNIMLSENHVVQLCGKLMSNGNQSAVSKSFNCLTHLTYFIVL